MKPTDLALNLSHAVCAGLPLCILPRVTQEEDINSPPISESFATPEETSGTADNSSAEVAFSAEGSAEGNVGEDEPIDWREWV